MFVLLGALTAYYVYSPIPNNIEERWKLMLADSFFRSLSQLVSFACICILTRIELLVILTAISLKFNAGLTHILTPICNAMSIYISFRVIILDRLDQRV